MTGEKDTAVRLATPVGDLPGVGPTRARVFKRLGIATVSDLIRHFPLRYEHESAEGAIDELPMDAIGSARGTVVVCRLVRHGRRPRFEATLEDHRGRLRLVWFNASYLHERLHPGMRIRVQGKVKAFSGYPQMVNPRWEELVDEQQVQKIDERQRPVYPATEDLPSHVIERVIADILPGALQHVSDPLPAEHVRELNMPALADAFRMIHQPVNTEESDAARRRLAYNELLLLQLGIVIKRHYNRTKLQAPALRWSPAVDQHIRARFPFALTPGQDQAVAQITADLGRTQPMNRLLQGDVGAGKTVVALYALLLAVADRRQGAIMTPTELLAQQHYETISHLLRGSDVRIALLTGGRSSAGSRPRAELLERIARRNVDLVIGTQALLTENVRFADLALVVVDEQHRFGVLQRAAFRERGGQGKSRSPHYLVMTATPIPRTLSLTVFGDLDVSVIQGLPPGRSPIVTRVVEPVKADDVYRYVARRVAAGEQAYVVVPTIDAAGHETARQLKSVIQHARLLSEKYFAGKKVEAIHGRLKPQTRQAIMQRFSAGRLDVLVATTVIEVGVDVPGATMMVVEHAERFGLAQLHQLRGRIGRGPARAEKSVCVFIAEKVTPESHLRLRAIADTTDGFQIAEKDLEIRGMGEFFGTRQHGQPPLKIARIPRDLDLLQQARRDAQTIIAQDPALTDPTHKLLRQVLHQQHGDTLELIDVG